MTDSGYGPELIAEFAVWRFVDRAAPLWKPWNTDSCGPDYLGMRRTYSVDAPWCTIEVESI